MTFKIAFYHILEHTYNTTSSNDIKLILGNQNGKVGEEPINDRKT